MTLLRWTLLAVVALALAIWAGAALVSWHFAPGPNYTWIEEGLTIGGAVEWPPHETRVVINLNENEDPYVCEVVIHEPIHDGEPVPDLAWLRRMVATIEEQRAAGRPIYLHCQNGVSRTGLTATAYYMWKRDWTRDEALAWLRARRPGLNPNPAFMVQLLEWEQSLKKDGRP